MAGSGVADLYLDACCFIYLIEGTPAWRSAVEDRLRRLSPADGLVTSRLSRLECRSKPLRDKNEPLVTLYDAAFEPTRIQLRGVTDEIIERATELRAAHGFRTPDAIHLATAISIGASAFLTGDAALRRCTEISVEVLTTAVAGE